MSDKKKQEKEEFVPTTEQRLEALKHVAYEIRMLLWLAKNLRDDPSIIATESEEPWVCAYLESLLLHARVLCDFFKRRSRAPGKHDVLVADYDDFPPADVGLREDHRLRLDKDLAHLTYDRLDRIGTLGEWDLDDILDPLISRASAFAKHVATGRALTASLPSGLSEKWSSLSAELESRTEQASTTRPVPGSRAPNTHTVSHSPSMDD